MAAVDEDEELSGAGGPLSGRAARISIALVLAIVLALAGLRLSSALGGSGSDPNRAVAAPTPAATSGPAAQAWPTVTASCGPVQRPFVSSTPVRERTGVHVLLGGDRLVSVDIDSGATTDLGGDGLLAGQSVIQLQGGSPAYAVAASCDANGERSLLRIQDGQLRPVSLSGLLSVLTDSSGAWALTSKAQVPYRSQLVSLTGPATVPLNLLFFPSALAGSAVVGDEIPGGGASWGEPPLIMARDAANGGRLRSVLGEGWLMTTVGDTVIWRDSCYDETQSTCHLLYATLGQPRRVRSITLPAGRFPAAKASASPNGKLVAFPLLRSSADASFPGGESPADIAVADLTTGRVAVVPGVQLPSSPPPGLAFSADSRWLIIALNAGPQVRLLAWRPGLSRPEETTAVSLRTSGQPPIVALSSRKAGA
jgi:hypothetical protein